MGTWQYNAIGQKAGAPLAASKPASYAWESDGTQHVFYRGADDFIHQLWFRKGTWNHNPIGQKSGSPPAAGDPSGFAWEVDKTQHVIYRGQDNQIQELWFRHNTDWQHNAVGQKLGAPPTASNPTAYAWEKDGTQHIFYRAADNFIHQLWFRGGKWNHNPISQKAGAPPAAGDPIGYTWEADGTQHVIYLGADSQIHELWLRKGHEWEHNALGQKLGAPLATSNPAAYAWERDGTQHVFYRAADNFIQQLWFKGGKWNHNPIGQKSGSPPAAGDPCGYSWEADGTQHVTYRGADNQLHELWFRHGKDWGHEPMGQKATAPQAASDPVGYAWEKDGTQHAVYRGMDNQIYELWYRK
jgi:hypothetical protein